MLQGTYFSNANNEFKNNEFSDDQWSAPYMDDKDEISDLMKSFKLEGRKIKDLHFVAYAYNLSRRWIEEYVFNSLEGGSEADRQKYSEYSNITPNFPFLRYAEIDEPLLIKFEDEDRFEISASRESIFRMSMNCIPWGIDPDPGGNEYNAEASVVFDTCIGKIIDRVEVKTHHTSEEPMTFRKFSDGKERELVSSITLWLNDDTGICIEPRYDYFYITLIDHNWEAITIPFKKLKDGLYNWEDLHDDEDTGFRSYCPTIWFGRKCCDLLGTGFISFVPER